ncbi:MAG: filamentous hemagglutinin N-terminal domain-containing protein [Waterburya sp.]
MQSQVMSQVVEDDSLATQVETNNSQDFRINGGEQQGNNLFHSFDKFSIPRNGSVLFNNALTIQNIISRVTGSSISEINGLIQSNGTANLFLLNPNGIIFGENATLNIGGSFIGTTAESLFFEDGVEFSTNLDNEPSLLTVSVPLGLQFGSNPGEITNQANFSSPNPLDATGQEQIKLGLTTASGKTFALLGNGIDFDGGAATAPMGNIQLGSVAENSFVALESIPEGWKINYDNVSQFQDLTFDKLASVDTSGTGGGDINVTGKNIKILNGSAITSNTLGNLDGGKIQIEASDLLEINGSDITGNKIDSLLASIEIFLPFASQISSSTLGSGKAGDVDITAQNLQLIDGGAIELQTFPRSTGAGGNLSIVAIDSIESSGIRPLLGVGDNALNLILSNIPLDTAIDLNQASEIATASISSGNAGNIDISTTNIRLEDGATIAVSPFSNGTVGTINIDSTQSIEIIGTSPRTGSVSSSITANTFADGNAGDLRINTNRLSIKAGGFLISTTSTAGDAGDLDINTSTTEISGFRAKDQVPSLISTQATGEGDGGNITLNTDRLIISDRGSLSVQGSGSAIPGNLSVQADSVELNNFGSITAETEFKEGGNIQLEIKDRLTLRENSLISAEAFNSANGGNLDLDARFVVAFPQENNDILANARLGNGGNIAIATKGIFGLEERSSTPPNLTNDLDASSEFGSAGTVSIFFPSFSNVEGVLKPLANYVDVENLLNNSYCKLRGNSQFIATGRNGIPIMPNDAIVPEYTWSDWRIIEGEKQGKEPNEAKAKAEVSAPPKIVMIQGWVADAEGNIVLTDKPPAVVARKPGLNNPDCNQVQGKK